MRLSLSLSSAQRTFSILVPPCAVANARAPPAVTGVDARGGSWTPQLHGDEHFQKPACCRCLPRASGSAVGAVIVAGVLRVKEDGCEKGSALRGRSGRRQAIPVKYKQDAGSIRVLPTLQD